MTFHEYLGLTVTEAISLTALNELGECDLLAMAVTDTDDREVHVTLTLDQAGRLMNHLSDWLKTRIEPDRGTTVYGIVALNNAGETCFFPTSLADGLVLGSYERDRLVRFGQARKVNAWHLKILDPPETP